MPEKKKMGRPTDNPKNVSIHLRLDQECVEILRLYCEKTKVPRTEAARRGIKKLRDELEEK